MVYQHRSRSTARVVVVDVAMDTRHAHSSSVRFREAQI